MSDGKSKIYPVSESDPTQRATDASLQVHGATVYGDGTIDGNLSGGSEGGGGEERPASEQPNLHIELSELADGEWIDQPIHVPDGLTLNLYAYGCRNDTGNTPSGLQVGLIDVSDGSTISNASSPWTKDTPISSVGGPADVFVRLINNSGGTEIAGATAAYLLE